MKAGEMSEMLKKKWEIMLVSVLVLSGFLFSGCASVISRGTLKEVDHNLRFENILENPEAYRGRIVLLGGDVIDTENFSDETRIVVLARPLEYRDKPAAEDVSKGRFIISSPGFLDPAIYRPGRKITVVGTVVGKEVLPLDKIEYTYPVIAQKELYLWPLEGYPGKATSVYIGIGGGVGIGVRR